MKREDAQIYIIGHRPVDYGIWDNNLYTPIQVGFNERFLNLRDNDLPDNISEWNDIYAEQTGPYYIWKHCHPTKYKGQCQFRRRLKFSEDTDFDKLFEECDVIVGAPLIFPSSTVAVQYWTSHCKHDLDVVEDIVKNFYPDYAEDWDRWINFGSYMFYANGFIMRSEHYDQYAEWLFTILNLFRKHEQWYTPEQAKSVIDKQIEEGERSGVNGHEKAGGKEGNGYQYQVCGFLAERLLTLYLLHNFKFDRIKCVNYCKYEGL